MLYRLYPSKSRVSYESTLFSGSHRCFRSFKHELFLRRKWLKDSAVLPHDEGDNTYNSDIREYELNAGILKVKEKYCPEPRENA